MTETARQYAFTEDDVRNPTQLAYLLNRLLSQVLSIKDTLDAIPDGVTYKKVLGVTAGQVGNTGIAPNAIGTPQLIANAVTAAKIAANTITALQLLVGIMGGNNEAQNSSFEDASVPLNLWSLYNNGPESATVVRDTSNFYHGAACAKVSWTVPNTSTKGVVTNNSPTQNVAFKPNHTYVVSWYAKATNAIATGMSPYFNTNPSSITTLLNPNLTTGWQRYAFQLVWGASVDPQLFISITNAFAAAANDLFIDAVQVEEGTVLTAYSPKADEVLNGQIIAAMISVAQLSAIAADLGTITAGKIQNAGATAGVKLSGVLPGTWTRYLDLDSGDTSFLKHDKLALNYDGSAVFNGQLRTQIGGSTGTAVPIQLLYQAQNLTTNSTVEVSVGSVSIPANALQNNGDSLRVTIYFHNTASVDQAIIKFGSTVLFNSTGNAGPAKVEVILQRTGGATQSARILVIVGGAVAINTAAPTETLSGAVTLDFRGKASVGADTVTFDSILVEALIT